MKVGFEAKRAFANKTGLGNYSRQMILGLLENKKDLELSLFTTSYNYFKWLPLNQVNCTIIYFGGLFKNLWRQYFQIKNSQFKSLDIYHGLSHEIPWGKLAKHNKMKWVVTIHDLIFLRYPKLYSFPDRLIYRLKFQHACKKADKIIAISKQTADDLVHFWNIPSHKIEVIYQSCDDIFRSTWATEKLEDLRVKYNLPLKFILYLGTLQERKNALRLVEAYHKVGKFDIPLVLVGEGGRYKDLIVKYVQDHKLEQSVIFLGRVAFEDLPGLYQACLFFAFPSIFEGFGIPIIEAIFSGKAVLTSKGSCFAEAAGPGGYYVDPLLVDDIAKGLSLLISDDELRFRLANEGLEYMKNFFPAKITDELYNCYVSLMKES